MYGDISLLLEFFFVSRDQRRMGSISGIHRSKRWQEHILKDVVDNRADTLTNKKRYETLYKEAIV